MQYWVPLPIDLVKEKRGGPNAGVIARLKPGVTLAEAQIQLNAARIQLQQEFPQTNQGVGAHLFSRRHQNVRQTNTSLLALLGASGLILLVTCANIASLLLAHGESRRGHRASAHTVSRIREAIVVLQPRSRPAAKHSCRKRIPRARRKLPSSMRIWPARCGRAAILNRLINTNNPQHPMWAKVVGVVAPMRNVSIDFVARPECLFHPRRPRAT
jgi:hypothetical protein